MPLFGKKCSCGQLMRATGVEFHSDYRGTRVFWKQKDHQVELFDYQLTEVDKKRQETGEMYFLYFLHCRSCNKRHAVTSFEEIKTLL